MSSPKFKFLEHPADIKLQVFGADLLELFINAALGMMNFLYGDEQTKVLGVVAHKETETIIVIGDNVEMLLVNWLSELLFLSDVHNCVYLEYQISEFTERKIVAEVGGYSAIAQEDIKAVTYHELAINKTLQGWMATVVFDI